MELLPSQRNYVLTLVRNAQFDPAEFAWGTHDGDWPGKATVPVLVHTPTGYFCAFSTHTSNPGSPAWHPALQGTFTLLISPGANHEQEVVQGLDDFNAVGQRVRAWLEYVRRESVPDLWTELANQRRAIAAVVELAPDNAPFSGPDVARVVESLDAIGRMARALKLTADEIKRVNGGVAYLKKAAERMGRKDWFLLACTMLAWAVPPDKAGQLLQGVFHALQWVVHAQGLLR